MVPWCREQHTVLTIATQELVTCVEFDFETGSAPPPGVALVVAPSAVVAVARGGRGREPCSCVSTAMYRTRVE
eukprot:SAG31_NODE_2389_length_5806_cov_3.020151_4_plen_73_part_00